ncbi:MAG: helix-turn-helix transcriptional regulator [Chitinophagaceae bacterium]
MTQTEFLSSLGARIKELRIKKNISQKDLAMECNFEKASMSRIESGKTNITMLTLLKIITVLEADIRDVFSENV